MQAPPKRQLKIGVTNDVGWGCTIRVGQMLLAHTILRHQLGEYNMQVLLRNMNEYCKVLVLMNDNADSSTGAFSIQNIARMSLLYDKFPGEFHGPGSISNVLRDLNKMYLPYSNFRVVHFYDGTIYLDKIKKAACQKPTKWLFELLKKDKSECSEGKAKNIEQLEILFSKYVFKKLQTQSLYGKSSSSTFLLDSSE